MSNAGIQIVPNPQLATLSTIHFYLEVSMSLVKKPEMTEKNRAAHRSNGARSQGAVTPEGKTRVASANLRHGFYSQAQNSALTALGEDPQEYAGLMNSLDSNFTECFEHELKQRIGNTLWRMKRADRMRDGLAQKRIQNAHQAKSEVAAAKVDRADEIMSQLEYMGVTLMRRDPTADEVRTLREAFGHSPTPKAQKFLLLLNSLLPAEDRGADDESPAAEPRIQNDEELKREHKVVRRELRKQVEWMVPVYQDVCREFQKECDSAPLSQAIAALVPPQDQQSMLMQRMEDSNLRQLWRLTNMLFRLQEQGLTGQDGTQPAPDLKNEGTSGDVYENTGEGCETDHNDRSWDPPVTTPSLSATPLRIRRGALRKDSILKILRRREREGRRVTASDNIVPAGHPATFINRPAT
jgi:hypothetical protein